MILDVNSEHSDIDMEYFQQLILSKVEKKDQQTYAELLAIRQMSDDWEAETELSNALAEIRKNEKEMGMIAMVAQTLVERMNDLQEQVSDQQIQITQHSTNASSAVAKFQALEDEVSELRSRCEKQDQIRDDLGSRLKSTTERKNKAEKRSEELLARVRELQDLDHAKDQKLRDAEFDFKRQISELEANISDLTLQVEKGHKEHDKLNKVLDEKEFVIKEMRKREKQLKSELKKGESELKKLSKKASEYKKYIKKVEDTILAKDEKLKYLEMFKKNSEICSQVESSAPRTELGELENFGMIQQQSQQTGPKQKAQNMLNSNFDDDLEPEMAFGAEPQYDDFNDADNMAIPDSDLPADFDNAGLNVDGLDPQGGAYNDLGEFYGADGLDGQLGADAMNFDGFPEQLSPGYGPDDQLPNDLAGFEEQNDMYIAEPQPVAQLVEQGTQTDDPREFAVEIQTQTEQVVNKEAITQTHTIEVNDEDCQTEIVPMFSAEVQVDIRAETVECGTEPDANMLAEASKELEESIIKEFEKSLETKRKNIAIMDSSGGQAVAGETEMPKPPKTAKAGRAMKFGFDDLDERRHSPDGASSGFSFKEQARMDYLTKRDPMQEFFTLTCQSVKLNSPHMNAVCTIDTTLLYKRATKLNIPFFKWQSWIEDSINKEFLRIVLSKPGRAKTGATFLQTQGDTGQKAADQAMFFQDSVQASASKRQKGTSSATKPKKTRGRSSYARPGLKIETAEDPGDELSFAEPRRVVQPLQSARSKLQSADKKDKTPQSSEEKHKDLKAKKIGQTPKPRKLLKGLSLFK